MEHVGILQLWISLAELVGAQTVTVGDAFERFAFTHAVACWTGIFLLLYIRIMIVVLTLLIFFEIICSTLKKCGVYLYRKITNIGMENNKKIIDLAQRANVLLVERMGNS